MKEKVSIIVPAYNCEKTIEKCLDSIINQTYRNTEIIVINDGSKDNTINILKQYAKIDKRIKLIDRENSGVSKSRNIGIEASSGEYISFVDADDWLEPNMIEIMVNNIKNEKVSFVVCKHFTNDQQGNQSESNIYELANRKFNNKEIYECNIIDHFLFFEKPIKNLVMLLLIKRKFLTDNDIYFDTSLYMLEDVYFYQKIFKNAESVYFTDTPLYHYYENINSVTRTQDKFINNIYGIIDANILITKYIVDNNLNIDLTKLNTNHIRIICDYINYICIYYNKEIYINLMKDLKNNNEYTRMLNNIKFSNLNIRNKIQVKLLFLKNYNIMYFFMKCLSFAWKIKNRRKENK